MCNGAAASTVFRAASRVSDSESTSLCRLLDCAPDQPAVCFFSTSRGQGPGEATVGRAEILESSSPLPCALQLHVMPCPSQPMRCCMHRTKSAGQTLRPWMTCRSLAADTQQLKTSKQKQHRRKCREMAPCSFLANPAQQRGEPVHGRARCLRGKPLQVRSGLIS